MKNWHFILLLSFFLSLTTGDAYACGSGKKCCKKERSQNETKKNCCGTGDHSKNDHRGCNGKCGNSSCITPVIHFAAAVPNNITITTSNPDFCSAKKPVFFYNHSRVSSGYYTIWLIPKISLS